MQTPLTELLGVEHPVMLAGMGGVSYHQLAAAVSEAGGFGCLGASTMGDAAMVEEIAAVRDLTDRPFGVDLLTAAPQDMPAKVQAIIEASGVKSGDYFKVTTNALAYDREDGFGVAFTLNNVQKLRDGEKLGGGGRADPTTEFESVATTDAGAPANADELWK